MKCSCWWPIVSQIIRYTPICKAWSGDLTYGATGEFGYDVAENKVSLPDFHATILHLLGLNHEKLTYRHAGRDFRLTDVEGEVIQKILAAA